MTASNQSMKPTARFGVQSHFAMIKSFSAQFSLAAGGGLSLSR